MPPRASGPSLCSTPFCRDLRDDRSAARPVLDGGDFGWRAVHERNHRSMARGRQLLMGLGFLSKYTTRRSRSAPRSSSRNDLSAGRSTGRHHSAVPARGRRARRVCLSSCSGSRRARSCASPAPGSRSASSPCANLERQHVDHGSSRRREREARQTLGADAALFSEFLAAEAGLLNPIFFVAALWRASPSGVGANALRSSFLLCDERAGLLWLLALLAALPHPAKLDRRRGGPHVLPSRWLLGSTLARGSAIGSWLAAGIIFGTIVVVIC